MRREWAEGTLHGSNVSGYRQTCGPSGGVGRAYSRRRAGTSPAIVRSRPAAPGVGDEQERIYRSAPFLRGGLAGAGSGCCEGRRRWPAGEGRKGLQVTFRLRGACEARYPRLGRAEISGVCCSKLVHFEIRFHIAAVLGILKEVTIKMISPFLSKIVFVRTKLERLRANPPQRRWPGALGWRWGWLAGACGVGPGLSDRSAATI